MAKSRVGQTTGRKLDAEMVAREMRRARDPYNIRLFQVLVFLSQSDALRQSDPDEMHVQASEEESNFSQVKEVVEIVQLQHPLVYDQQDPCALAMERGLKNLKLPMLRCGCEDMGLDIPLPFVRGIAPYSALVKYFTNNCTCRKYS